MTARDRQLSFVAASIAYYMLLSLFPVALLALVVASVLAGETLAEHVMESLGTLLSPNAAALVREALLDTRGRLGATALALGVLLWTSMRVFLALNVAFTLVYGHDHRTSLPDQLRDATIALVAISLAVGVLVGVVSLVSSSGVEIAGLVGTVILVVALTCAFLPIYYVFPDTDVTVEEALPGAILAAGGWTVLGTAFTVYAALANSFELYRVAGGLLLLVGWFYAAALLLLLGAVVNAVLAEQVEGDRQLQHATGPIGKAMTAEDDDGDGPARDVPAGDGIDGDGPPDDGGADGAGGDVGRAGGGAHVASGDTAGPTRDGIPVANGGTRASAGRDLTAEVEALREELADLEAEIEDRTVDRADVERDLHRYVRRKVLRTRARGWGPYIVLLYGTVMTVGAFQQLSGGWAVLAMVIVWLSTLGLYVLMVIVGAGLHLADLPGRAIGKLRDR